MLFVVWNWNPPLELGAADGEVAQGLLHPVQNLVAPRLWLDELWVRTDVRLDLRMVPTHNISDQLGLHINKETKP